MSERGDQIRAMIERLRFARTDLCDEAAALLSQLSGEGVEGRPAAGDGWIEWNGGECPFPKVAVRLRDGREMEGAAHTFGWGHFDSGGDIVAYRTPPAERSEAVKQGVKK